MRTLADAMANANRIKSELPILIQPSASDCDMVTLLDRIVELEHTLKVCHADANRALLSGIRGDYQGALLSIRLTTASTLGL